MFSLEIKHEHWLFLNDTFTADATLHTVVAAMLTVGVDDYIRVTMGGVACDCLMNGLFTQLL